jgi:hypothetical protein
MSSRNALDRSLLSKACGRSAITELSCFAARACHHPGASSQALASGSRPRDAASSAASSCTITPVNACAWHLHVTHLPIAFGGDGGGDSHPESASGGRRHRLIGERLRQLDFFPAEGRVGYESQSRSTPATWPAINIRHVRIITMPCDRL